MRRLNGPRNPSRELRAVLALIALEPCVLCHHEEADIVGVYVRGRRTVAYSLCSSCCAHSSVLEDVERSLTLPEPVV